MSAPMPARDAPPPGRPLCGPCAPAGHCRGYPWRCHRTMAEIEAAEAAAREAAR